MALANQKQLDEAKWGTSLDEIEKKLREVNQHLLRAIATATDKNVEVMLHETS